VKREIFLPLSLTALFALALGSVGVSAAEYKICLTGTLVKVFPDYGKAMNNGSAINLDTSKFKLQEHFYDQNPLAPLRAMKEMVTAGCHGIIGFDFTDDLMIIRKLAEENNMLVISLYGDFNGQLEAHPTIRTMQIPTQQSINHLFNFASKSLGVKWQKPFVVTDVDRESMRAYRAALETRLGPGRSTANWVTSLERSFNIDAVKSEFVKQLDRTDVVVLLTRSRDAAAVSDMVYSLRPRNPPVILGTKFFGSATLPAFQNMLKNKSVVSYVTRQSINTDPDPQFQEFLKKYTATYKSVPMDISALANDAIKIFDLAAKKIVKGKSDTVATLRTKMLEAARKISYAGVTGVNVAPPLKFTYTKSFIIKIDQSGYNLVEEP
jgi:hypothetical protein